MENGDRKNKAKDEAKKEQKAIKMIKRNKPIDKTIEYTGLRKSRFKKMIWEKVGKKYRFSCFGNGTDYLNCVDGLETKGYYLALAQKVVVLVSLKLMK